MLHPSPGLELALVPWFGLKIDLGVLAFEARGKPELRLAAIAPMPSGADQPLRQIIAVPSPRAAEDAGTHYAGLLLQLAQRCGFRVFALVEASLRHLPPISGPLGSERHVGALADEDSALAVDEHHADARPVG